MTHAEVVALIDAAIGTPGRLRTLLGAATPEGDALRAHLADCPECRAEAGAWQAVDEALVAVTPDTMVAPPAARSRILANVVATGVARGPDHVLGTRAGSTHGATVPGAAPTQGSPGAVPTHGASVSGVAPPHGAPGTAPTQSSPGSAPTQGSPGTPPTAGRVWRTPGGRPLPSPVQPSPAQSAVAPEPSSPEPGNPPTAGHPSAAPGPPPADAESPSTGSSVAGRRGLRLLPGGQDRDGVGFRVFLAVAAAAVFLFALGAALGGPLGLTSTTTVQDTTARAELERVTGRMADLLQLPGAVVAPLSDRSGEPAGAVVLAPADTRLLGVVTRALPRLEGDGRYVCVLVRGDERYVVGLMVFADDPSGEGDVAYWIAPLDDTVPLDIGAPGDVFNIWVEGDTGGEPILTTTF